MIIYKSVVSIVTILVVQADVCPEGFFWNGKGTETCQECINCEELYRETRTPCQRGFNTECDDCLLGYYEDPDLSVDQDQRVKYSCLSCPDDCTGQESACQKYYSTSNATCWSHVELNRAEQDGTGSKGKGFPFFILFIIAAAVGGIAIFVVIMKHKTGEDRKPPKKESFPHEREPLGKPAVEYIELSELGSTCTKQQNGTSGITEPGLSGHTTDDQGHRDPDPDLDSETLTLVHQ